MNSLSEHAGPAVLHGPTGSGVCATASRPAEIAYAALSSPIGELLLAATDDGLVRLAFETESHDAVLDDLARQFEARVCRSASRLADAARELEEYFAGRRRAFETPLDLRLTRGFRGEVQRNLAHIPYGQTRSYGRLAAERGRPGATRAVGTACATNPLPLFLPCHRVLRGDGALGGYRGGLEAKAYLLGLEGVPRR